MCTSFSGSLMVGVFSGDGDLRMHNHPHDRPDDATTTDPRRQHGQTGQVEEHAQIGRSRLE